jgi:hypothetical protein
MRLPLISPSRLTAEQKALYDEMRKGIATRFSPGVELERAVASIGGSRRRLLPQDRDLQPLAFYCGPRGRSRP